MSYNVDSIYLQKEGVISIPMSVLPSNVASLSIKPRTIKKNIPIFRVPQPRIVFLLLNSKINMIRFSLFAKIVCSSVFFRLRSIMRNQEQFSFPALSLSTLSWYWIRFCLYYPFQKLLRYHVLYSSQINFLWSKDRHFTLSSGKSSRWSRSTCEIIKLYR